MALFIGRVLERGAEPDLAAGTIEVSLEGLDALSPVVADYGQIQIVFSNLIRNAFEATSGAGRLRITGQVNGSAVEMTVADSGRGIPPEIRSRIMEPFFTTKGRGLGAGIGNLALDR